LNGSQWSGLLKSTSVFVHVRLSRKQKAGELARKRDGASATGALDTGRLIEYADLSSDESDYEQNRMAVDLLRSRDRTVVRDYAYSDAAEATRQRRKDTGYVFNKPRSLANDDVLPPVSPRLKVFKRPTLNEASIWDHETALAAHHSRVAQKGPLRNIYQSGPAVSTWSVEDSADVRRLQGPKNNDDIVPPVDDTSEEYSGRKMPNSSSDNAVSIYGLFNEERYTSRSYESDDKRNNFPNVSFEPSRPP
jgi:hypothetical protein